MAACAALSAGATAATAAVLPPDNSAANQYTEAYPTQGGSTPARDRGHAEPAKALGAENAKRLEAQGADGRAAAQLAAATAPEAPSGTGGTGGGGGGNAAGHNAAHGGGASSPAPPAHEAGGSASGSAGLGKVLGQATGSSSSGQLGLFLPLLIACALVWSVVYALRRRRRAGH